MLDNNFVQNQFADSVTATGEPESVSSEMQSPGVSLANYLAIARKHHASDVLIMVGDACAIRAGGHWERVSNIPLSKEDVIRLSRELLDDTSMAALERKRALDFSRTFEGLGRIRCNLHYQRDHLAMVLRLLWPEIPPAETLGIPQHVIDAGNLHDGLILVSGSTGSGKSTTLAAIVEHINRTRQAHVITIEDPIEFIYTNKKSLIEQREIGGDTPSWHDAIRDALRQAPDVIVLGELRDLESIQIALMAAETGHLVMGSVHSNTAVGAVSRILDVFPAAQQPQIRLQLSQAIRMVFAQRLLPGLKPKTRVLAYEILTGSTGVQNLIRTSEMEQIANLINAGRAQGMISLAQCRRDLVARGLIHPETEAPQGH